MNEGIRKGIKSDPYFWSLDDIIVEADCVKVLGFALPFNGLAFNLDITLDGQSADHLTITMREKAVKDYPFWPNSIFSSFEAVFNIPGASQIHREVELTVKPKHGTAQGNTYSRTFFHQLGRRPEMPSKELQKTIGTLDDFNYLFTGRTLFRHFEAVLKRHSNRSFSESNFVLDWGCGPGRVAMHVLEDSRPKRFLGLDIVDATVDWAKSTLDGDFQTCQTEPPLDIASDSVDVIYAYSVLTHIPETLFEKWLEEISRVMVPGGYFLATVLCETAMAVTMSQWDEGNIRYVIQRGVFDGIANDGLEHVGFSGEYYRNIYFTKTALEGIVSKHFEIVEIVENFHFYQDLLVLRKR